MKQESMFAGPDQIRSDDCDEGCERDLFGNPIRTLGPAAPTYRPRKPVQQGFTFDIFTLGNK